MAKTKGTGKKEAGLKKANKPSPQKETHHSERFCSFCKTSSKERFRLIAGPANIFICDECIAVCLKILMQDDSILSFRPFPKIPCTSEGAANG
jgi:hypothetical protein